jgi:hypothetical protein
VFSQRRLTGGWINKTSILWKETVNLSKETRQAKNVK